ncbi:MAG: hypothetical protein IJW52_06140 [Clostridia bacterium]|nr:hypothetical protein [Clostridia bacterium]
MLKVLPIQSKINQEEICLRCGVKYDPDLLAYSATVDDELAGVCQFKLTDKGGMVYDLAPVKDSFDFEAMFVLGRGTLNFIDLCGVHYAIYRGEVKDEQTERLVKAVGFKLTDRGTYEVNLEGFFTDHCHKD